MSEYVSHPLLKENTVEKRAYQENILKVAERKNTLVVLPTGIGKTVLAVLLSAKRLELFPESKILILAPTRPLVAQHKKVFEELMNLDIKDFALVTGHVKPEKREKLYRIARIIFATPQTIKNDLEEKRLHLREFSLLVVDEAHRTVGNYAYVKIAKKYMVQAEKPLILALTASPGGDEEKIKEICENLFIRAVEIRSEYDEDVKPYIKPVNIEIVKVSFDQTLEEIREKLKRIFKSFKERLREYNIRFTTKKELLEIQKHFGERVSKEKHLFPVLMTISDTLKVWHALELLETQSTGALRDYLERLKSSEQGRRLFKIDEFKAVYFDILKLQKELHPKMKKLKEIVRNELKRNPQARILIFSHYRDNIEEIYEELKTVERCKPCYLIGQAGERGLSQKEQIMVIEAFEKGEYNCMIGSPVSEEGLHIPSVDIGIFYDAVPSEIRLIQRRGRIGRVKFGKIIFLLLKKSRDEAYFYTALRKEKRMKQTLRLMKIFGIRKKTLFDFG